VCVCVCFCLTLFFPSSLLPLSLYSAQSPWLPLLIHSTSFPAFSNYQVLLGRNNLFKDEPFAQRRLVRQSFRHPDYIPLIVTNDTEQPVHDHSNDLMLLHLSEPADITGGVKVIDLPTKEPKVGSTCLASGWGSTNPSESKSEPGNTAGCERKADTMWLGSSHHPLVS